MQINSYYEFYDEIDLSKPGKDYIAPSSDTAADQRYKLLSVLVHAGANQGGHYYAYIRPDGKQWYKFDDETVTQVEEAEAIAGQFGEDPKVFARRAAPLTTVFCAQLCVNYVIWCILPHVSLVPLQAIYF